MGIIICDIESHHRISLYLHIFYLFHIALNKEKKLDETLGTFLDSKKFIYQDKSDLQTLKTEPSKYLLCEKYVML